MVWLAGLDGSVQPTVASEMSTAQSAEEIVTRRLQGQELIQQHPDYVR